jgi:predicted AAA+ superfamily ATPase
MKEIFKDIILERQLDSLGGYVRRRAVLVPAPRRAVAVIGVRRCGKTTFLHQVWDELRAKTSLDPACLVYVNFFDERLFGLAAPQLGLLIEAHAELYPDLPPTAPVHFFLDEIQTVKGWEYFVDRLLRSAHRRVILSGSSATLLGKEVSSAMRGRSLTVEMFPFAFSECLAAEGWGRGPRSPHDRARLVSRFGEYLKNGGFPETLSVDPTTRKRILQEYLSVVLLKDVIERHNPSDPAGLSALLRILMNQIGGLYTINKLTERLASLGFRVTKREISRFIEWFQDAYLLFSVPLYVNSISRQMVNPRKVYCIDSGLAYHVSKGVSENTGHLLENVIFNEIRRRTEDIHYYKDAAHREVDFVARFEGGAPRLVQVCAKMADEETRRREIQALFGALGDLRQKKGWLVTLDERGRLNQDGHTVEILPAWEFLENFPFRS